ncbi:hypothetical protein AN478_00230 [Thiohalorhabdus denitrificans]|uniref:HTH domain-containing protein n=1 Tax=Thiohalorhabdus denitrificans TaxID=381306 RepID=A0A0P9CYC8_9GAMM|nr:type II toxin-antitoxin system HipA family toxin YjjJ [Thiohalorhabdus denitrificans]KPV41867.1 hypothetical protein AN478_00230 [Thiohalorhabdus denitrificans]SCY64924.1 HTH domain-containing protein [Thiohalorhabdus denitrificans]
MALSAEQLIARLQALGTASRSELAQVLGVSTPTVYRHLQRAEAAGRVVRFGRGRATRYAVRAPLFNRRVEELPLYRVDGAGTIHHLATLAGLANGATLVRPSTEEAALPRLLRGDSGNGHYDDLPFFLQDLRPQGFLGHQYAHRVADLPDNPDRWTASQVGAYLLDHAVDLPGDLLLGDGAVERFRHWSPNQLTPADFPAEAERVLAGEVPGSSAGGEQPKFPAAVGGREVLVKFSPAENDSAAARRQRDLLVCEHLALATLAEHGLPVAKSRLHEAGGRLFLESERFDRTAQGGRLPALSLWAVDAEFAGAGQGWGRVAAALARQGWLTGADRERIETAEAFADWIENTDQHLGNITLQPRPDGRLALAPLYDMVPMRHAPRQSEVPPTPEFHPPVSRGNRTRWAETGAMAADFWRRAGADERVSEAFRELAAARHQLIEQAVRQTEEAAPRGTESGPGW